jgi:alpha-N-arabinofuranosidase
MTSHNTFDEPHTVAPAAFAGASSSGDRLHVVVPPRAVIVLELR